MTDNTNGIFGLDKSKYPARMGKPWNDDESIKLLNSIQKKRSINDIAKEHERTPGGITSKLKSLAVDYYINDMKPIEKIMKYTGLTEKVIMNAVVKTQYSLSNKAGIVKESNNEEPTLTEVMLLMKDLQQKMNIILEKIQ